MFDKYMCYCSNGAEALGKSIADAETRIPQLEANNKGDTRKVHCRCRDKDT